MRKICKTIWNLGEGISRARFTAIHTFYLSKHFSDEMVFKEDLKIIITISLLFSNSLPKRQLMLLLYAYVCAR